MAEEIRHPDGRIEHPDVRYEPTDANAGWIFAILAGAIVFGVIIFSLVFWFFHGYSDHLAKVDRSQYPLAQNPSTALPGEPRLEQVERLSGDQKDNVYEREQAKLRILNGYGPTEKDGFVHIPIEQAMKTLVEKKMLKARPELPAEERKRSAGLVDAGASNSGRLLRGKTK